MLNRAVRAASARAPSAAIGRADRQRAFRHAEAPAWVAEQRVAAVAEQRGWRWRRIAGGGGRHQ